MRLHSNSRQNHGCQRLVVLCVSIALAVSVNLYFQLHGFWTYLLLYIAIANGIIAGLCVWRLIISISNSKDELLRFLYAGSAFGLLAALFWINNQISTEMYINQERLFVRPPYIDYFRFYLIGLMLGVVKSFYYAILPSILFFAAVGALWRLRATVRRPKTRGG